MKKIILSLMVSLIGSISFAQEFQTFKLKNGQTLIVKEIHNNPIVTIDTWINAGSIYENDKNNGVAHFLEHLFFKGTDKLKPGEFDRILESKGAVINAATSKDFTHYYIIIPSKEFKTALELHGEMLLHPALPQKELDKERNVVIEEIIRQKDNPQTLLYDNFNNALYKSHPYKRDVIGTKEVISSISRADILDFYDTYYKPSNMYTVVVGDIDAKTVAQEVERVFSVKAKGKHVKHQFKKEKRLTKQQTVAVKAQVENGYLLMGYRTVDFDKLKDSYALDVLATILGDGRSSRLYKDIKEHKQLAFAVNASHSNMKDDGMFTVSANFAPDKLEELKQDIFNQIEQFRIKPVSQEEMDKAKSMIETGVYYSRESTSNIANEVGYSALLQGDTKYYENYLKNIKKVTTKDLMRVAKKYLTPQNCVVSELLPENYMPVVKQHNQSKPYTVALLEDVNGVKKYNLVNKATLLIEENKQNDIVAIRIYAKGGTFKDSKPGTSSVLASMLLKGTKNYNKQELNELLEQSGIEIAATPTSDLFVMSVKTTKNKLDLALKLFNEVFNNAILDSNEIENVKTQLVQTIKSSRDNPFSCAFEEFKSRIWKDHAYGRTGRLLEKTIPQINKADVQKYYNSVYAPENVVISINGNVDTSEMVSYFSTLFENKHGDRFVFKADIPVVVKLKQAETVQTAKDINGAWIIIGWQTCGFKDLKDWATLEVIDTIMGGGMSSRLFVALREDKPLAYQVGSNYIANYNGGVFALHVGTNGATAKQAEAVLFEQINSLKTIPVDMKELQEMKNRIKGNFILSQETNNEKAATIGFFEATERGFEFRNKYLEMIEQVTPQDIIKVTNKYFQADYVKSIVRK